jgi:pyruvate/2-oxoglutarate dehydrogenase complex dihydrolipoamide dehydrogenase (E3) component
VGVRVTGVRRVGDRKEVTGVVDGQERTWTAPRGPARRGRTANVEGLGLEELGLELGPRGVAHDDGQRTGVRSVWAAGDVAGGFLFTHAAGVEAARAVRNLAFPGRDTGPLAVPWCTFTDPELAHAGLTAAEARAEHGPEDVEVWRHDLSDSDRARAEDAADGGMVLVTHKGRLVGAPRARPVRGRGHPRARAGHPPEAQAHRPGVRGPRVPDDRARDPARGRRGELRAGAQALLPRALRDGGGSAC